MKHKPFAPRKRFIPALIAFVCTHWNNPGMLYSVTFPPIVKGTGNGNNS
jgi:hypothetical protein